MLDLQPVPSWAPSGYDPADTDEFICEQCGALLDIEHSVAVTVIDTTRHQVLFCTRCAISDREATT